MKVTKHFRIDKEIVDFLEERGYRISDLARMGVTDKYYELKFKEAGVEKPVTLKADKVVVEKTKRVKPCEICGDPDTRPYVDPTTRTMHYYCKRHYYELTGVVIEGWNDEFETGLETNL